MFDIRARPALVATAALGRRSGSCSVELVVEQRSPRPEEIMSGRAARLSGVVARQWIPIRRSMRSGEISTNGPYL
jgi:hypothetical protein